MKRPGDYIGLGLLLLVFAVILFANDVGGLAVVLAVPGVVLALIGAVAKGVQVSRPQAPTGASEDSGTHRQD